MGLETEPGMALSQSSERRLRSGWLRWSSSNSRTTAWSAAGGVHDDDLGGLVGQVQERVGELRREIRKAALFELEELIGTMADSAGCTRRKAAVIAC
jgi:hypothetical protein